MNELKGTKVGVISLGCCKNQVDSERMLGLLALSGCELVHDPKLCDVIIVNTCGFIDPAKQESIDSILEMAQYKEGKCRVLVATGCLTERYRKELADAIPEIDIMLGVREYDKLPSLLAERLGRETPTQERVFCGSPRILTTPPYSAYLRIADGCDNRCTYCAIPIIRGGLVSEPKEALYREASSLAENGVSELSIVAQDTSGYGRELYGKPRLIELIKMLLQVDGLKRIRLLYTYPDTVTTELLDLMASEEKLCSYLDIPLQHINAQVLRRMNRRGSPEHIKSLLTHLYRNYPDFTLRTTMMVGFPGETDAQFEELMSFIRDYPFDRLGAFAFSAEEGTKAAEMKDQIPEELKAERLDRLMSLQREISRERAQRWMGRELTMLVTGKRGGGYIGRTEREAPDVDGAAIASSARRLKVGEYAKMRVTGCGDYDIEGEIL